MSDLYEDSIAHLYFSYDEFRQSVRDTAKEIKNSYKADAILCIARGGLLVGGQLAYDLGIKTIGSINMQSYTEDNKILEKPLILFPSINLVELSQKNIIIADDVADTGSTLLELEQLIKPVVKSYKVMTIFKKSKSQYIPDFYWKETPSDKWIVFPWSKEDPLNEDSLNKNT